MSWWICAVIDGAPFLVLAAFGWFFERDNKPFDPDDDSVVWR